jgi:hypothetical protein
MKGAFKITIIRAGSTSCEETWIEIMRGMASKVFSSGPVADLGGASVAYVHGLVAG